MINVSVNQRKLHDLATLTFGELSSPRMILFFLNFDLDSNPTSLTLHANVPSTNTIYTWRLEGMHLDIGTNALLCTLPATKTPSIEEASDARRVLAGASMLGKTQLPKVVHSTVAIQELVPLRANDFAILEWTPSR